MCYGNDEVALFRPPIDGDRPSFCRGRNSKSIRRRRRWALENSTESAADRLAETESVGACRKLSDAIDDDDDDVVDDDDVGLASGS